MAFFTLACAFHNTERLLGRTLPLAIRSLTYPTRHDFEVILVAERASEDVVARLVPRLADLGVDELRWRRTDRNSFSGAPSNNFHGNHFTTTSPYLITFTDDTFIHKTDEDFDVLDATAQIFEANPEVALISKVDDHEEWDWPLEDVGPEIEPGVRSVNRVVDQLIAYDTARFAPVARRLGAFHRDTFVSHAGFEYQWENLASHVGTSGNRKIAYPERWPLRVRHSDLRNQPGSMHGTQDEDVKLKCFERLMESQGLTK
ncbi:hypothetical protein [Streptomyces tibetensis]|uniref:hypothetical protein n=1 Tax=Streptomyces tibetensis TaxID=2382123 RepID=UPI00340243F2